MHYVQPEILRLSKALGEETRFAIYCRIAASERPQTVRDLVRTFGMHHSAIRIHLNKLEDAGLIASQTQHVKGAVGRPQLAFVPSASKTDISLPPRNYQFLARLALDLALNGGHDEPSTQRFGVEWGRTYVREGELAPERPLPLDQALVLLAEIVRALGGNPHLVAETDGRHGVVEGNCLFGELSGDYEPTVCRLHQAVLRGMLEELCADPFEMDSSTTIASGSDRCRVVIRGLDAKEGF